MESINLEQVWSKSMDIIKSQLDPQIFAAWIQPLLLVPEDDEKIAAKNNLLVDNISNEISSVTDHSFPISSSRTIYIAAPNKFCCDHVQRYYGGIINTALNSATGIDALSVNYTTISSSKDSKSQIKKPSERKNTALKKDKQNTSSDQRPASEDATPHLCSRSSRAGSANYNLVNPSLNPNYNFSNFVVGSCNQFAHAVSLQVAQNLGSNYNPLFIYGGVGLGKTHLVNAIGNYAHRSNKKALLVSSEIFVNELISAIKSNKMQSFKDKFRSLDLLVIDDIQFLKGKERTQEEFFHTFNELHQRRKQIVLTSDKVPQELIDVEERLRTRFASGLSADLQAPDFETRVAILAQKADALGIAIPEHIVALIAEKINSNVRELEGALNRLQAFSHTNQRPIDLELATEALKNYFPEHSKEISIELIQETLANKYHVSKSDMLGKRRTLNVALARQIAMFLSRKLIGASFPEIGALFGGRDHSTVIYSCNTLEERMEADPTLKMEVEQLEKRIRY